MTSITQQTTTKITARNNDSIGDKISPLRHPLLHFLASKLNAVEIDAITVLLKNGESFDIGFPNPDTPHPVVTIKSLRMILRGWASGLMGWAEGYMADDWDIDDTRSITHWAMANEEKLESAFGGSDLTNSINRLWHRLNNNSLRGSRKNIQYHYDLGNDFYRLWLDDTMTYSAALFESDEQTLADAQHSKYQRILELLAPEKDQSVLEIGCGWGGFARELLQHHDVSYTGVTLSDEQLAWAEESLQSDSRAQFSLTDYRNIDQRVDRIASIEMFEAVGESHWPTYFAKIKSSLNPGGVAVLQVITIDHARLDIYRSTPDFIQKYIFPGGMLPSTECVRELIESHNLRLTDEQCFGRDYARTLKIWHQDFLQNWPQIAAQGFDQRFYRMWRYYLAYCEAGFNTGAIDVRLYRIVNDG